MFFARQQDRSRWRRAAPRPAAQAGAGTSRQASPRNLARANTARAQEARERDKTGRTVAQQGGKEGIVTKELWLRVHDDGREECYDHDPAPIRALHIVVTDGVEETWTSDQDVRPGWREPVPPPGKG